METDEVATRQRTAHRLGCAVLVPLGLFIGFSSGYMAGIGIFLLGLIPLVIVYAAQRPWFWLLRSAGLFALAVVIGAVIVHAFPPGRFTDIPLLAMMYAGYSFVAGLLLGLPGTLLVVLVRWYKSRK